MNWIETKDSLPNDHEDVIVYGKNTCCGIDEAEVVIARFLERNGFEYGEYSCSMEVTHWMKLPEKPDSK